MPLSPSEEGLLVSGGLGFQGIRQSPGTRNVFTSARMVTGNSKQRRHLKLTGSSQAHLQGLPLP